MQFAGILFVSMAIASHAALNSTQLNSAHLIAAHARADPTKDAIGTGCQRICSHWQRAVLKVNPQCHQRCQADVYNCIENTLPKEERDGDRFHCIQEALMTRIREDGGLETKLKYDVEPTFDEFNELYRKDGRFDDRDAHELQRLLSHLPPGKVEVVKDVYKEADTDGDGVVTEGEFNDYAKDSDTLHHDQEELPDLPDLIAKKQKVFRSSKPQQAGSPQKKQKEPIETNQFVVEEQKKQQHHLAYFQHLLHLGLQVYREEEKLEDPVKVEALHMYEASKAITSNNKKSM